MDLRTFYEFIEGAVVTEMRGQFEDVHATEDGVLFRVDAERSFLLVVDDSRDGVFDFRPLPARSSRETR